ncbi:PD-(D/E)XK nuclease family protein [Candidatus Magnetominusculus dajiuhuensis]|uniref:PDDEXK-like family protein n=1 Tax=Candidatus Magnetominusculus dajiuhuensis TaxID=3137712 RepID=UPI003B43B9DB
MLSAKYVTKLVKILSVSQKQQAGSLLAEFVGLKPIIQEHQSRKIVDIASLISALNVSDEQQKADLLAAYEEMKPKIQAYRKEETKHLREYAPQWNVFKVLGVENREIEFHTPFLYGLLNPYGTHGQGRLFLDGFLTNIGEKVVGFSKDDISNPNWYVERDTEQIDLRICNDWLKKGFYIENKVQTVARIGQMSKYVRLWQERYESFSKDGGILYLTVRGDDPSDVGFDSEGQFTRSEIEQKIGKIGLLSYKRDIKSWLEGIVDRVKPQKLKQSIIQYIEIINDL